MILIIYLAIGVILYPMFCYESYLKTEYKRSDWIGIPTPRYNPNRVSLLKGLIFCVLLWPYPLFRKN